MEPFVELVRFDTGPRLSDEPLRQSARELLAQHLARRPAANPFMSWAESLREDLPRLLAGPLEDYHAYAFVTVRMVGSAFELFADHLDWVLGSEGAAAACAFRRIVEGSKTVSFRLARRRSFDPEPAVAVLAEAWEDGMAKLGRMPG